MGKKSKDQELGTIRDYLKVHVAWTEAQLSDNEWIMFDGKGLHIKF